MKIRDASKNQSRELAVLGAAINNAQVLHSIAVWKSQYDDDLFLADAPKQILDWCLDHYKAHGEAPGDQILRMKYLEPWEEKLGGGELPRKVDSLRISVAENWESSNFRKDQLFDITEEVLRRQQVLIASDRMGGSSSAKIITDIIPGSIPVSLTREPEFDSIFENPFVAKDVTKISDPVFEFQNEIVTKFFDDSFAPSTFTAFIAPEKRGKSQWLLECTVAALQCEKTVLYFDAGDMTEDQIFLRFAARGMKVPYKPGPYFKWNELSYDNDQVIFDVEEIEHQSHITQKEANRMKRKWSRVCQNRFFSRNFPRGMLTIATIRSILDSLSIRGIRVDVVIVDYADILGTSGRKYQDNRFAVTEIWGDLRTLSQSYDVALITATQANALAYTEELSERSYSESKTKRAFITAEVGIDRTDIHEGIFKLSYTFRRTGTKTRPIFVGSDLATYQPASVAMWVPRKMEDPEKFKPRFRKDKK